MAFREGLCSLLVAFIVPALWPQSATSSSSPKPAAKSSSAGSSPLNPGSVSANVYRNPGFGFTCKIPQGWVLRTDDLNAQKFDAPAADAGKSTNAPAGGRVLLAAFSRPPEAHGEEINSSVLIAAESASAYPGLKDAAQYFGPLTEITEAQGFQVDEEPYEFAVGAKTLVRGDFEKDVGSRVMHQSTLVMLARGYAVSFTFIAGADDEVEELIEGLSFSPARPQNK